jgi:PEGA domain
MNSDMKQHAALGPGRTKLGHWCRAGKPLISWCILVLLMYGIRTHQRLMDQTRLRVSVLVQSAALFPVINVTCDGRPVHSGEHISLGTHKVEMGCDKAETFSTNVFAWYGGIDLGVIQLKRANGHLEIHSNPRAARVFIRGPEFYTNLTGVSEIALLVPTDQYNIEATYAFSREDTTIQISDRMNAPVRLAPQLGSVHIGSSHSNTGFRVAGIRNDVRASGETPALIEQLPPGQYEISAERDGGSLRTNIWINSGSTTEVPFNFRYGSITFDTDPPGTRVLVEGSSKGVTPVTFNGILAGSRDFTLTHDGYEPVTVTVQIVPDQTKALHTNLLSMKYVNAVGLARQHFEHAEYDKAAEFATAALFEKENDSEAARLKTQAEGMRHFMEGKYQAERNNFVGAISEMKSTLKIIPEDVEAKQLLSTYVSRETEKLETEKRQAAEREKQQRKEREREAEKQRADDGMRRLRLAFDILLQGVEGATQFGADEMSTSNKLSIVRSAIDQAFMKGDPAFHQIRSGIDQNGISTLQVRQSTPIGYRDCFICAAQLSDGETKILFKVLDYDHPPASSVLGGLFKATVKNHFQAADNRISNLKEETQNGLAIVKQRLREACGEHFTSQVEPSL